jgi:excinuclease ABC subunit B
LNLFPAKHFVTPDHVVKNAVAGIRDELATRVVELRRAGTVTEAQRLSHARSTTSRCWRKWVTAAESRTTRAIFPGEKPASGPFTLLDFFPQDFLCVIDESHVTLPQVGGMYNGDRSRKLTLVEHGFRLPSALDNRPLKFEEFSGLVPRVIYVERDASRPRAAERPGGEWSSR